MPKFSNLPVILAAVSLLAATAPASAQDSAFPTREGARPDTTNGVGLPGLFAAGEVAGFGGGGYHGYNALEGTFLGDCIFSGRNAGRSQEIA